MTPERRKSLRQWAWVPLALPLFGWAAKAYDNQKVSVPRFEKDSINRTRDYWDIRAAQQRDSVVLTSICKAVKCQ